MSAELSDLSLEETRIVLEEMEKYVKLIVSNVNMERRLFLVYSECVDIVFDYFYKIGQLSPDNDSFDPETMTASTPKSVSILTTYSSR